VPRLIKPRALAPGAVLAIAAPGGPVDSRKLAAGEALFRDAGFETLRRDDLLDRRGYLAGDDARRVDEFMGFVEDDRVDGIVCARGGYGCDRILTALDAQRVRAASKPLVGYSDITALLLWQRRCAGLVGFHGPMLDRGDDVDPASIDSLVAQLCGSADLTQPIRGDAQGGGRAEGRLVGGSLTLVVASIGTTWEIDTRGVILLLEDVGERPYRIDRMLQQLRGAGKLERLAGVGIGDFSSCRDDRYPETGALDVIGDVFRPLGVPFVSGLPFGHVRSNAPWAVGCRATIDGDVGSIQILEQGVKRAA
jgi:muramoyltetrapeptide carboxypeptidase